MSKINAKSAVVHSVYVIDHMKKIKGYYVGQSKLSRKYTHFCYLHFNYTKNIFGIYLSS